MSGQSLAWRSADPSVASLDSLARVSAIGAGRTVLIVSTGDLTAELPLEVYPAPGTITLLAGDGQRAPAGVSVRFGAVEGSGRAEQVTDTSDAEGIVESTWTLGDRPGRQRFVLGVAGDASIATSVVAEAEPLAENTRMSLIGGKLSGRAGAALDDPVGVRVTDSSGAPLADLPVTWEAEAGGTIVAEAARTDSLGGARAQWALGSRSGMQQAHVQVGRGRGAPRLALMATALPGPAALLALVKGAPSAGDVGRPLASLVTFRVADRSGNPVPGVPVAVRPASGSVSERAPITDSVGCARVAWVLGPTAGAQRLGASIQGVGRGVELTVRARPGLAALRRRR